MRITTALAMILALAAAHASAQEAPYSRTLDEQLARIKQGKSPVPQRGEEAVSPDARKSFPPAAESHAAAAPEFNRDSASGANPPAMSETEGAAQYRDRKGNLIDSTGGGAIPALPLMAMQAGDVKFITGGVGDEELAQLKAVEGEYNVRILIASKSGEFLSQLSISLLDAQGQQVAAASNAGPYFYASLKPGQYTMEITNNSGVKKAAKFTAPASGFIKPVVRY